MPKRLNEDAVLSELQEGSIFFQQREVAPPAPLPSDQAVRTSARTGTPRRPSARPAVRVDSRRVIRRHPFEFYADQLDRLKQLSLEEQMAGGSGSMSEMVREALDRYLQMRSSPRERGW